jgi:hypothetical protein
MVSFVLGLRTTARALTMKSQDILLLLKLVSLHKLEQKELVISMESYARSIEIKEYSAHGEWQGWELVDGDIYLKPNFLSPQDRYSLRNLEAMTGISKTEASSALKRSIDVGLATIDRKSKLPRVNNRALFEFITYGIKYVFPANVGGLVRGIPTSFSAPVMSGKLMTAGETINVWPDPVGKEMGQSVEPLYKSVPKAVKQDPELYKLLALIDAIRIGNPREAKIATGLITEELMYDKF